MQVFAPHFDALLSLPVFCTQTIDFKQKNDLLATTLLEFIKQLPGVIHDGLVHLK